MGTEQRRQNRLAVALEVHVRGTDRAGLGFEESVFSTNISRGGCSVEISRELDVGAAVEVEILRRVPGPAGVSPFLTQGVVMRCVPGAPADPASGSANDLYSVGIQFTGPQFPTYASENTGS